MGCVDGGGRRAEQRSVGWVRSELRQVQSLALAPSPVLVSWILEVPCPSCPTSGTLAI